MIEDQDEAYYIYGAGAFASGDNTFTEVDSTSTIVDHGPVTTARINIKAKAVADGDSASTSTYTNVDSNSDISVLINFEQASLEYDGVSYNISNAKFIGICLPDHVDLPDGPKNKVVVINHGETMDLDPTLDGNIAALSFQAEVSGESTYFSADLGALAVEDTFSVSTFQIEAVLG